MANPFDDLVGGSPDTTGTVNPFDDVVSGADDAANPFDALPTRPDVAALAAARGIDLERLRTTLFGRAVIPALEQAQTRGEGLRRGIGAMVFAPSDAVREAVGARVEPLLDSPSGRALIEAALAASSVGSARQLIPAEDRQRVTDAAISGTTALLSGLPAAPFDPTTYAFLATGGLPLIPRILSGAAIGATPALLQGTPEEAGVQGLLAGALSIPGVPAANRSLARAPALAERLPGIAPESFLVRPAPISLAEAEAAAREAAGLLPHQLPLNPRLRSAVDVASERAARLPIGSPPDVTPSMYEALHGGGVFPEAPRAPALDYPQGRLPRTRTVEGGFLALPEEQPGKAAGRQVLARSVTDPIVPQLQQRVDETAGQIRALHERLSQRAELLVEQQSTLRATGTLEESARQPFREAGPRPATRTFQFSEEQIRQSQAEVEQLARTVQGLRTSAEALADPFTAETTRMAEQLLNRAAERFNKLRFAAGRSVKAFDQFPLDIRAELDGAGVLLGGLKTVKARLPLYTSIVDKLKRYNQLLPKEQQQLGRDLIDAYRLNLFPVLSFSRDILGNATELGLQAVDAAGRDLAQATRGHFNLPNLQGIVRAFKFWEQVNGKTKLRTLPQAVREGVGTARPDQMIEANVGSVQGGFRGAGIGTFTRRATPATAAVDYVVGSPLYAKGVVDTNARRLGASAELWARAGEAANQRKLRGLAREQFMRDFWERPPADALEAIIAEGNKAGFNRPMGRLARAYAGSKTIQLLADAFPRWSVQAVKALGEWLGYRPDLLTRWRAGTISREDLFGYAAKTMGGWGGLWWINQTLYDQTDFNSMEYVKENGNRVRLSSLDPITTGLWLVSLLRGDVEKTASAFKYASVPLGKFADPDGGSGILSSLLHVYQTVKRSGRLDPRGVAREFTETVNRLIPGQAVAAMLKAISDPVQREGVGANLPGLSQTLPARINRATGQPLQPRQRVFGREFPAVSGTTVPGGERVLDPVTQLLSQFGLLLYRGQRSPMAGVPPNEIPDEWMREWQVALGEERQRVLLPIAQNTALLQRARRDKAFYEVLRKQIQTLDAGAARRATLRVSQARGGSNRRLPRQPTLRERRLPSP